MKIYKKKGMPNYKEKRMLSDIEAVLNKKFEADSEFAKHFQPANNYDELVQMHKRYAGEEIDFEEVTQDKTNTTDMAKSKPAETSNVAEETSSMDSDSSFIDPFNREEPIVRDYVLTNEYETPKTTTSQDGTTTTNNTTKTDFAEPISFQDAFEIPEEQIINGSADSQKAGARKSFSNMGGMGNPNAPTKKPTINPDFGSMEDNKQKKKTRKFAKYIVAIVSTLAERGFVWYANKDINEAKLTEYEVKGEMDLSIIVNLPDGQQVTIKRWFQEQCLTAEQLAQISEEEKNDLAEALAEVLLEKGVAPTPMQELMLVSAQILASQGLKLIALRQATNSLLNQLRVPKEDVPEEPKARPTPPPPPPPPPPASRPEPQPQPQQEPQPTYTQVEEQLDNIDSIFDDGIVTKE